MKNCIACPHFIFDSGWGGSDVTPGDPPRIGCEKNHWLMGMYEGPDTVLISTSFAEKCPDYSVSDLAKSKGW